MERMYLNENCGNHLFEEDLSTTKPPKVLKVVKGCVADWKKNRNGRVYPKQLWENVINSDYVKEMIRDNSLFGEGDHPEERNEISLQNVSHAIKELWIDEEKQQVWAELHILDTPIGNLISNLIEYGTHIGVSSRGAGEVDSSGNVNPDTYKFFTFDLVCRPSVADARPSIVESEQVKMLSESEVQLILDGYKGIKENSVTNNPHKYSYVINGERKTI